MFVEIKNEIKINEDWTMDERWRSFKSTASLRIIIFYILVFGMRQISRNLIYK